MIQPANENEFRSPNKPMTEQELWDGFNVGPKTTGIPQLTLWIGPDEAWEGARVKVNNWPDSYHGRDCFIISIPDLRVIGSVNESFITSEVLSSIKAWCALNEKAIVEYSEYKTDTVTCIEKLKPLA